MVGRRYSGGAWGTFWEKVFVSGGINMFIEFHFKEELVYFVNEESDGVAMYFSQEVVSIFVTRV